MRKQIFFVLVATCFVLSFIPGSMFAGSPPTASVNVANPPDAPIPVFNVENPARSVFIGTCEATIEPPIMNNWCYIDVPAGKRVVIEYVGASCANALGNPDTFPAVTIKVPHAVSSSAYKILDFHLFALEKIAVNYAASRMIKIYADPGPGYKIAFDFFHTATGDFAPCVGTVSGYTVDYP